MVMVPHRRKGTAGDFTYTCRVGVLSDGWGWWGHKRPTAGRQDDDGEIVAQGGPVATDYEAERAADQWFFSIPGITE